MNVFKLIERLEAVERGVAELREVLKSLSGRTGAEAEDAEKPAEPVPNDAKLQEGIANLMGYDPSLRRRSNEV